MALTEEEKAIGLKCLNGELDFRGEVDKLVKKYAKADATKTNKT